MKPGRPVGHVNAEVLHALREWAAGQKLPKPVKVRSYKRVPLPYQGRPHGLIYADLAEQFGSIVRKFNASVEHAKASEPL